MTGMSNKTRPILFSAPMVRAILSGAKTQTRRVMKDQPCADWSPDGYGEVHRMVDGEPNVDDVTGWGVTNKDGDEAYACKYGQPGDSLWVRETWSPCPIEISRAIVYRADGDANQAGGIKWKPSIFMPRNASRITLKITGVRVERLTEISQADTIAEGMPANTGRFVHNTIADYRKLWVSINGAGSWDENPWVWVIGFERVVV